MTAKEIEVQLALGTLSYMNKVRLSNNKRTSKKALKILSTDENWGVRSDVAENPNTPIDVLKILSTDEDRDVRYWAARKFKVKKDDI